MCAEFSVMRFGLLRPICSHCGCSGWERALGYLPPQFSRYFRHPPTFHNESYLAWIGKTQFSLAEFPLRFSNVQRMQWEFDL